MKKAILFLMILDIFTAANVQAQTCNTSIFTDDDKRDFDDKSAIMLDVDGDGNADTITPRIYNVKASGKGGIRETHWITFDLETSSGRTLKSFFRYKYGDNRADYWIYKLGACKLKQGKLSDLVFYVGDDTSDVTIVLKNMGSSFKIHSRKENVY